MILRITKNTNYLPVLEKYIRYFFNIRLEEISILTILKYDFRNKLGFEIAKFEISRRHYDQAKSLLYKVVTSDEADWRSTYRCLYLLYLLSKVQNSEHKEFYLETLKQSNKDFPLEIEPVVLEALGLNSTP